MGGSDFGWVWEKDLCEKTNILLLENNYSD
jgi:hypothetical protein